MALTGDNDSANETFDALGKSRDIACSLSRVRVCRRNHDDITELIGEIRYNEEVIQLNNID